MGGVQGRFQFLTSSSIRPAAFCSTRRLGVTLHTLPYSSARFCSVVSGAASSADFELLSTHSFTHPSTPRLPGTSRSWRCNNGWTRSYVWAGWEPARGAGERPSLAPTPGHLTFSVGNPGASMFQPRTGHSGPPSPHDTLAFPKQGFVPLAPDVDPC